jgi:hypothetical protein
MKTAARMLAASLLFTAVGTIGCAESYQNRPMPSMASTADRWVDTADNYAYMRNINQRGFIDDINRTWYIDNPTRLSPWPIVDMSGNPR